AANATGTTPGADQTFTTAAPVAPSAATGAAGQVTRTSATLTGTADGNDLPVGYRFEWGTTSAYGNQTALVDAASGVRAASTPITGLVPGTTYHYRVVAVSSAGQTPGADQTLTTADPVAAAVTLGAASGLTPQTATLAGTVDGNGLPATFHLEYGSTTAYGSSTPATAVPAQAGPQPVTATLSGLAGATTYHYR